MRRRSRIGSQSMVGLPSTRTRPVRGIDQTVDQLHRRGFARTAAAEQHQGLSRVYLQIELFQQDAAVRQGKTDVAKLDSCRVAGAQNFFSPMGRIGGIFLL